MVPNSQERDPVSFRATYIFACHFSLGYRLLLFRNFQLFTTMYASYTENWQGNIIVFPFSIAKLGLLPLSPFPAKFDTTIWIIGVRTSGPALWCVGGEGDVKTPQGLFKSVNWKLQSPNGNFRCVSLVQNTSLYMHNIWSASIDENCLRIDEAI